MVNLLNSQGGIDYNYLSTIREILIVNTIMRIQDLMQPIVEGREAPLYHWVDKSKLYSILQEDEMKGYWFHIIPEGNRRVYGSSLTRNKRFVYPDRVGRLTFDQGKLAQTNRIIPLDAEVVFGHTYGCGWC